MSTAWAHAGQHLSHRGRVISSSITWHLAIGLGAMFQAVVNLDTSLTNVDGDALTHGWQR